MTSQGSSRKSERNRYTIESVNKLAEEVLKPGVCNHPQHHSTTLVSLIASDGGDGSRTHTLHGGTSKSTFSDHRPPVMTTDQETGMRKFVEHPSPTEQGPIVQESTSKSKKPTKLPVASSESYTSVPSTPTEGRSTTSSSSSSAAPTPVQQRKEYERKGKGLRKSSTNKMQKVSPVLNNSTAKHRGGATVQPTLQQAPPPSPQVEKEHLERKESESSLRSIDSESTSSTSDKSEKEENATSPGENPEVDSTPPLAKEPGTGQTIPLLLAQEEFLLSKTKQSPPEPVPVTSPLEDGEGKREEIEKDGVVHVQEREVEKKEKLPLLPTPRPRSKKKLRQQQRKEDKLRRKERERERVREREEGEKRKEQNVESEVKQTTESPELQLNSTLEETTENMAPSHVAEENKPSKIVATSPKKAKKVEVKTLSKSAKLPSRSRTAPAHVTVPTHPPLNISPSPVQPPHQDEPEERSDSPEVEQLAQTWPATELEDFKESPESLSPSSQPELTFSRENSEDGSSVTDQSDNVLQSSHPMEAIPMSALRAMRAKGSKQHKKEEEGFGAPTTSPKKNVTTARKTKEVEKTSTRSTDKPSISVSSHAPQVEPRKKKSLPNISPDDTTSTDSTPSPEPSKVIDELIKSPHEIAATLLSKNSAIKKRKVKSDPEQEGSDEGDDLKYEKHPSEDEQSGKVLWAADGDKHQMGLMRHYKPPTRLSLDAEPFYPSSDYVPRVKQHRKYHHPDTPYAHGSHLNIPSGFPSSSPAEESGMYFERKSRVREIRPPHHLSLRSTQLRHHGNTLTPSPPPYVVSSDTYYAERHGGIEPSESSRYPHISPDVSPYDIQHDEFYSPSVSGRHIGVEGLPGPRSRMSRSSALYDDQMYSSSQQHEAAVYAAAQRRERHPLSHLPSTGSLWDQQLMQDEETALLRRQQQLMLARKLREEQLVKMHARRSAEALTSLNYPQSHLSRSTVYPDATSPWDEDVYLPAHQVDETFLTEPMHPHPIRQPRQQLLQEHMSQVASYPRRRRYSSDNEVGGEFLPDLLQTPSSPGPISSSTGLNKAPGTAFSGMAQARAAAVSGREHDILSDNRSEVRCVLMIKVHVYIPDYITMGCYIE